MVATERAKADLHYATNPQVVQVYEDRSRQVCELLILQAKKKVILPHAFYTNIYLRNTD